VVFTSQRSTRPLGESTSRCKMKKGAGTLQDVRIAQCDHQRLEGYYAIQNWEAFGRLLWRASGGPRPLGKHKSQFKRKMACLSKGSASRWATTTYERTMSHFFPKGLASLGRPYDSWRALTPSVGFWNMVFYVPLEHTSIGRVYEPVKEKERS